jgi:hypothetical protein
MLATETRTRKRRCARESITSTWGARYVVLVPLGSWGSQQGGDGEVHVLVMA